MAEWDRYEAVAALWIGATRSVKGAALILFLLAALAQPEIPAELGERIAVWVRCLHEEALRVDDRREAAGTVADAAFALCTPQEDAMNGLVLPAVAERLGRTPSISEVETLRTESRSRQRPILIGTILDGRTKR